MGQLDPTRIGPPVSTPQLFRTHETMPTGITSALFRRLIAEWVNLHGLPSTTTTLRGWGRLEPVLAGHERPGGLVDAIDAACPADEDALLLALLRLTQDGHQLAGRIVVHAMLPKIAHMATRTAHTTTRDTWAEDRRHSAVAELWTVIATYRVDRRPSKVAGNLALDTLHRLTAPGPATGTEIPTDPLELPTAPSAAVGDDVPPGELSQDVDLAQLLTWATRNGLITLEDARLLTLVYTPDDDAPGARSDAAARRLGLTPAAVRQRCARTRRRLTDAVRAELAEQAGTTSA